MEKYPSTSSIAEKQDFGKIDYSPWGMIFYRDHMLSQAVDELSISVNCGDYESIRPYFAVLRQILINVQPLFKPRNITKWFKEINDYEQELIEWEEERKIMGLDSSPTDLIKHLRWFHRKLLFAKQYVGYGVPRRSKKSTKDEIRRALMGE